MKFGENWRGLVSNDDEILAIVADCAWQRGAIEGAGRDGADSCCQLPQISLAIDLQARGRCIDEMTQRRWIRRYASKGLVDAGLRTSCCRAIRPRSEEPS